VVNKRLALRGEQEPAQILWQKAGKPANGKIPPDVNFVRKAVREYLQKREQPAAYLQIHAAALTALAEKGMLHWSDDALSLVDKTILKALQSKDFVDVDGRANPESGTWGLRSWNKQESLKGL